MEIALLALLLAQPSPVAAGSTGRLVGHVVEKGGGGPVIGAAVRATADDGGERRSETDSEGRFELTLAAGQWRVTVPSPEHKVFEVKERILAGQLLQVRYLLERVGTDPYRTVVIGRRDRRVVARTSLAGPELARIPGTLGDPFRVVGTLPGAGSVMSLSPYPVVRGTHPGATGYLIDGVPVPQLFHLLGGPAVLHPHFIERVDFYPGGFPVRFGGYIGGIVEGVSRRSRPNERRLEAHADLTKVAAFARGALGESGVTGTVAFRYGYPGLLLDLLESDLFLRYWDYQARLDGGVWGGRWRLFVFGTNDEAGPRDPEREGLGRSELGFHRLDLGWRRTLSGGRGSDAYQITLGKAFTDGALGDRLAQSAQRLDSARLQPRAVWDRRVTQTLRIRSGLELVSRRINLDVPPGAVVEDLVDGEVEFDQGDLPGAEILELEGGGASVGGFVEVPALVTEGVTVTPGLRMDIWSNRRTTQIGLDPRLRVRWQATQDTAYEAQAGVFHQPPRFVVPVPGLEEIGLARGLLRSMQVSAGVQTSVASRLGLGVTAYYADMDPLLFDLSVNNDNVGELDPSTVDMTADQLDDAAREVVRLRSGQGRSYGVEVLLRRQRLDRLFGWVSYTLSRSERRVRRDWAPFDFDRTHILNVVTGVALPRNWEVGVRGLLQTGRPESSATGHNDQRLDTVFRLDLRVDKRAVWRDWMLDFHVDVANATMSPEQLSGSSGPLRFVIPSVGLTGVM